MPLPLTPSMLAASYDYLRSTPPLIGWNLPEPEDVAFKVSRSTEYYAKYVWDPESGAHTIIVSVCSIGYTSSLMAVMAHEMIRLHLRLSGMESKRGGPNCHNAAFRKLAARVCRVHGFDPRVFY